MNLEFKSLLRMSIVAFCGILLVGVGFLALQSAGLSAWQMIAEPMGWDTEEPPFFLTVLALVILPLLPRLPFVLKRDLLLEATCVVDAPKTDVWETLQFKPNSRHYQPQIHRVEQVADEADKVRLIMKHLDTPDHSKKMSSVFTRSVSETADWVRYDFERTNGLPAWDRKLKWMAFNLEDIGNGKTRLGVTKLVRHPRVWGCPFYIALNPALHDLSGVKALAEGRNLPSNLFTLWLDMFKPEPTYEGWSTEEWQGLGLDNPWQRWALFIALGLPMGMLVLVITLVDFSK